MSKSNSSSQVHITPEIGKPCSFVFLFSVLVKSFVTYLSGDRTQTVCMLPVSLVEGGSAPPRMDESSFSSNISLI